MGDNIIIDKTNNFDFLRLLFSSLVIVSHSFYLTLNDDREIGKVLTDNQFSLGELSVNCFFVISGYLIYKSLNRSLHWRDYMWKRILRLYPGLIVMLLFTLAIVPFFHSGKFGAIFSQSDYWQYLYNLSLFYAPNVIEGVFTDNPFGPSINGSLWSLSFEFTMYLGLSVLFFIANKKIHKFLLTVVYLVLIPINFSPEIIDLNLVPLLSDAQTYRLGCYFFGGSLLAVYSIEKFPNKKLIFYVLLFLYILGVFVGAGKLAGFICLPTIIILFGLQKSFLIKDIGSSIGDISYGVYIYGWLVQQSLLHFFNLSTSQLTLLTLLLSYILGYLSWHLIEKKALLYKNIPILKLSFYRKS